MAITVVLAIGVAGCGGDDSSTESTSTAAALTEEEFVAQGNEICTAGNEEIEAAGQGFTGEPNEQELDQYVADTLVPGIQSQIDAIAALSPPRDLADQVDTFLADAQTALDELEADPSELLGGSEDPFEAVNELAIEIGLDACAG